MKNKQLSTYLLWAFLIAWILQAVAIGFVWNGMATLFQPIVAVSMFAPLAAAALAGVPVKEMGWGLKLRGKGKWVFAAWLGFAVLAALGAALYFLLFPAAFDTSGATVTSQYSEEALAQLEAQGLTIQTLILISFAQALTYAPFFNALFAVGEEAGWRGALYPMLKARFGVVKGRVLGGVIWGVWHWPIMILVGYNYGSVYWGAPVLGPLLFCVICASLGVLLDYVYEQTGCIWIPALAHGAFNAFAGLPSLLTAPAYLTRFTLGPSMIGLIGGLPMLALAALLIGKGKAPAEAEAFSVEETAPNP